MKFLQKEEISVELADAKYAGKRFLTVSLKTVHSLCGRMHTEERKASGVFFSLLNQAELGEAS